jgi:lycopene cyclase domain-containing protein
MSYSVLAAFAMVVTVAVDLGVLRTRLLFRRIFWVSYAIVLVFQLLMNGVLTGRNVVRYDPGTIVGLRIAYAPIEDLFFGFAMVTLTLSMWVWLGRRANSHR